MSGKSSAAIMPMNSINFIRTDCAIVAALTLSAMGSDLNRSTQHKHQISPPAV